MRLIRTPLLILLLLSAGVCPSRGASTNRVNEIPWIDKWCKAVGADVKAGRLKTRYFANIGGAENPVDWKEWPSPKAVENYCVEGCNEKSTLFFRGKTPVMARCFFTATDYWFMYVDYYFREDGTVARVDSDLRRHGAYVGDRSEHEFRFLIRAQCSKYFDSKGVLFKSGSSARIRSKRV